MLPLGPLGRLLFSKRIGTLAALKSVHGVYAKYKSRYYSTFKAQSYALHILKDGPSADLSCTKEDALELYKKMTTIRRFEQASAAMYTAKVIRGFCHLYSGQEAVAVGMKASLTPEDHVITSYRCHGWTYLMGISIEGVLCELTGRKSGVVRGKGGSMHMYAKNFYGGNGIVGGHVPIGVGTAFACKYLNSGGVGVALYGDGAANQGQISEVFNMAKLWNLPMIFVCENNLYAMGTSTQRGAANAQFYTRGDVIPGIKCDGMDVLAMREVTKFARDYALKNGPIVMEAVTYRYFGHSMSDPGTSYRSRDEVQEVRQNRDPITSFKNKILTAKLVSEDEIKNVDEGAKATVDKAVATAKADKEIDVAELTYDICTNFLEGKVRNNLPWKPLEHKNIGKPINLK